MMHDEDEEPPYDAAFEAAHDLLDANEPEAALAQAAQVGDEGRKALIEGHAYIALGMLDAAHGALDRAKDELGDDLVAVIELEAHLAMDLWELEVARNGYGVLAETEPTAWVWEQLALLADLAGDTERADRLMQESVEKFPERGGATLVSDEWFDETVTAALATLKPEFAARLENVRIVREPVPFRELIDPNDIGATPPHILGLFLGPTIQDLSEDASAELPPTIYLFKRNLERFVRSEDELAEEIRVTLFHEIGHLLGLDEDGVADLGLA